MAEDLRLIVAGQEYTAWKSVQVTRSIQAGSGSFEFTLSDRFPGKFLRPIQRGDACEIRIGDTEVQITGYVSSRGVEIDGNTHEITIRGRDKVGDLIDCEQDIEPAEWYGVGLLQLAQRLAQPFGISVRTEVDLGPRFAKVTINPGQSAWDLIETQARYRQVLPISDGLGGLLFTRAGRRRTETPIIEGQNLQSASSEDSEEQRFSHYIVKGQETGYSTAGPGDDQAGESVGRARDLGVKRFRPKLIVSDLAVDSAKCRKRARWEALTRAARGISTELTVVGWRDASGQLWPLNGIVPVRSPTLALSGEYLISEVTYSIGNDGGITTALTITRPDAFQVDPETEKDQDLIPSDPEPEE